jgi:hypothetical protein
MMQREIVQPDVAYASPVVVSLQSIYLTYSTHLMYVCQLSTAAKEDNKKSNVEVRENLSVIRSSVLPGFSLRGTLGSPNEAADRLLSSVIAPAASGK